MRFLLTVLSLVLLVSATMVSASPRGQADAPYETVLNKADIVQLDALVVTSDVLDAPVFLADTDIGTDQAGISNLKKHTSSEFEHSSLHYSIRGIPIDHRIYNLIRTCKIKNIYRSVIRPPSNRC